jgi:adenosylhomocysteine nucleosidase
MVFDCKRGFAMPILDFGIITALPEEFIYLEKVLGPFKESKDQFGTWFRCRRTAVNGTNYELVLSWQDKMGPLDAYGMTARLIDRWDPAYILLVGIAGQVAGEVKLGDIVVGQQIFYYDPQALKTNKVEFRPEGYPAGVALVRQVHAVVVSKEFRYLQAQARKRAVKLGKCVKLNDDFETEKARKALSAHAPKVHVGTVASGSKVVKSEKVKRTLLNLHGKILGVEMEGCGLMDAAFFHRENPSQALLIKGISDGANDDKAKLDAIGCWRELATENSARLALAIIHRGQLTPQLTDQFDLDPTVDSVEITKQRIPDTIRRGYSLLGFQKLIVPRGPLTKLTVSVFPEDAAGKLMQVTRGLIEYSTGGSYVRAELTGQPASFVTEKVVDRQAIGIYLMIEGIARDLRFEVSSASSQSLQIAKWIPETPEG